MNSDPATASTQHPVVPFPALRRKVVPHHAPGPAPRVVSPLGRAASTKQRARHLWLMLRDTWWMARVNRLWWLPVLVAAMILAVALVTTTQTAVPYAVYTLF